MLYVITHKDRTIVPANLDILEMDGHAHQLGMVS